MLCIHMGRKSPKEIEADLLPIAKKINSTLIHQGPQLSHDHQETQILHDRQSIQKPQSALEIRYYHCKYIEELVRYIRDNTRAKHLGATHHVLNILFNQVEYSGKGVLEYTKGRKRYDSFLKKDSRIIEVKTIKHMTIEKLYNKIVGVIESERSDADVLWVFYFYRMPEETTDGTKIACHYLLTFIGINIVEQERKNLREELIELVERSKEKVAEKVRTLPRLIIPLENLVMVEDLKHDLEVKNKALEERDKALEEKYKVLKEKDKVLKEKDKVLKEKDKALKEKDKVLKEKDKALKSERKEKEKITRESKEKDKVIKKMKEQLRNR